MQECYFFSWSRNCWLDLLKAVLPKHCEVLEIAALPPGVSIEFCLVRPVLPQRLNAIPRSCSWSWCYPANAWGESSSGTFAWDDFFQGYLWISVWGHPFDMAEVPKLLDTYSIDNGNSGPLELLWFWSCLILWLPGFYVGKPSRRQAVVVHLFSLMSKFHSHK